MDFFKLAITVLGGLSIFIYGMGLMSEGLTQIAGSRLKAALGFMTRNRVAAILAGTGITALIQSSSATTVMTVGFVNAGLLSLEQAIGVIFGANVGTTITGQLVSFKLSDIALPAVTLGVIGLMVAKRQSARGVWRTVLGFGFLFFGMTLMGHELKAVAKLPEFVRFFSTFDCTPTASGFLPIGSVLGAIAVGTLCTMLAQSSSATIGITIALAEAGLINIWTAVPIVLGDNIGTTITAAFAAIGTNVNAKRTALAHALFNLVGTTILVTTFVFVFSNDAGVRAPAFFHLVDCCTAGNGFAGANPGRHIAMAHTLFNVTNVILLAFFIPLLARACRFFIRSKDESRVNTLEPHLLATPALALEAVRMALGDMTRRSWTVASVALQSCLGKADVSAESIENAEREIDELRGQIRSYLIEVSQRKLSAHEAEMIPELLHCANDAERISDLALKVYRKTDRVKGDFADARIAQQVSRVAAGVRRFAHVTVETIRRGTTASGADLKSVEGEIRASTREAKAAIWSDPRLRGAHAKEALAVLSVFNCLRDIARHLGNIAVRAPAFT